MTQPQQQPGWFPDPAGTSQLRYFDGRQWTSQFSPLPPPPQQGGGARKVIFGVIALIVFIAIVCNSGNDDDGSSSTSASSSPSSRIAAAPATTTTRTVPSAGSAIRDGKFEFRVLNMVQQETVGDPGGNPYMQEEAQGVFYLLTLEVTNIGNEARGYFGANQKLIDTAGREYSADNAADMYMNDHYGDINPGNSIQVFVAFDVPPGTVSAELEVHDSMLSGGARVRL